MRERHSNQKHHEMKDFKQTELFKRTTGTLPGSFVLLWFAKYRVRKGRGEGGEREGRGRGEGGEREGRGRGEGGEREGRGRGEGGENFGE